MAICLHDLGADLILNTFFIATDVQSLNIHLYTQATAVTDEQAIGDFTEATGGGYALIALTRGTTWVVTAGNDPSDAIYNGATGVTFTFTGAIGGSGIVYGYYVTNNANTVLIWSEPLTAPFTPANNGDTIKIIPKIALATGTPAA